MDRVGLTVTAKWKRRLSRSYATAFSGTDFGSLRSFARAAITSRSRSHGHAGDVFRYCCSYHSKISNDWPHARDDGKERVVPLDDLGLRGAQELLLWVMPHIVLRPFSKLT